MARLTERVTVSLPVETKARLCHRAERSGVSLGAVMRDIVDDLIAEQDLTVVISELERRDRLSWGDGAAMAAACNMRNIEK